LLSEVNYQLLTNHNMDINKNFKRPYIIGAPSHRPAKSIRSVAASSLWEDDTVDDNEDEHTSKEYRIRASEQLHKALAAVGGVLQKDLEPEAGPSQAAAPVDELLKSPPVSPGDVGPVPASPRANARAAYFKRKTYPDLIRTDHRLRKLLDDVVGIREWWTQNKTEWRRKKNELAGIGDGLTTLESQALYDENVDEEEIETYRTRHNDMLKWFEENRTLMRLVWNRFQMINGGVTEDLGPKWVDIVNNSPKQNPIFIEVSPTNIRFQYRSPRDPENAKRWLVDLRTAFWWLETAHTDLRSHHTRLKDLIERLIVDKAKCAGLIQTSESRMKDQDYQIKEEDHKADLQIQQLMEERPEDYKVLILSVIEKRRHEKFAIENGSDRVNFVAYKLKAAELDAILKVLTEQDDLVKNIATLVQVQLFEINENGLDARNREVFLDCHQICYLYSERRELSLQIRSALIEGALPIATKYKIIARINTYIGDYSVEELPMIDMRYKSKDIQIYRGQLHSATRGFITLADDIPRISRQAEPASGADYRLRQINDPRTILQRPRNSSSRIDVNTLGFASNMTLALAKFHMDSKSGVKSNATIIRELFTSPDIFIMFHPSYNPIQTWIKDEFFERINSKLEKKLSSEILEAFLVYCTHSGELFRVSYFGQKVIPILSGWETCYETRKSGVKRSLIEANIPQLEHTAEIEQIMDTKLTYFTKERYRTINRDIVREAINSHLPRLQKLDTVDMHGLVAFWTLVGRYYVKDPKDGDSMIRINNAWKNIDMRAQFTTPLLTKHRYYNRITEDVFEKDPETILQYRKTGKYTYSTETELYNFWFRTEENGQESGNWETTRHKFHLFLRWCTARKDTKFE
jgi:hypothetical protein